MATEHVYHTTQGSHAVRMCCWGGRWGNPRRAQGITSRDTLTSTEVRGTEELHTLIAGQQMRPRPRWGLGCVPGDGDRAEALNKEASGIAGHQDASLKLIQQALGRLQRVRSGKHHLLYHAALRV